MKPSDFINKGYCWDSVFQSSECETTVMNILHILSKNGDTFRELRYEEYEAERKKDGNYSIREKIL